jgi:hypothetical protein
MAKFYGEIGYGETVEKSRGVFEEQITERKYYGDLLRNARQLREGDKINNDLTVNNSISIIADAYANEHFFAILYVKWAGAYWLVTEVEVNRPRLTLRLGGVYNGPRP